MKDNLERHDLDYISPYVRSVTLIRRTRGYTTWLSNETENLLLYLSQGSMIHTVNGHSVELREGMIRMIPPYANQVVGEITSEFVEFYCIYFDLFDGDESRLHKRRAHERRLPERETFFSRCHCLCVIEPERRGEIKKSLDFLAENFTQNPDLILNLQLKSTMLQILTEFFSARQLDGPEQSRESSALVSEAMRYAEHNFADPALSVSRIAAHLGISSGHLSRLIKRESGHNMSDVITDIRIRKAKDLFALGKRISHVAEQCGFISLQSFSRTFRRVEGISPREYTIRLSGGEKVQKNPDSSD